MTPEELAVILESHKRWLSDECGERANLQRADLQGANLQRANLDYSCLPLWCGLLDVKIDERLFGQFAYHLCRMDVPDDLIGYQDALREVAKKFHRFDECGGFKKSPKNVE